jgi:hypothetical protein
MSRELSRYFRGQEASSRLIQGSKEASLPDHYHLADAPVKTDTMSVLAETKFTNLMLSARCAALVCPCRLNGKPFPIACLLLGAIVARAPTTLLEDVPQICGRCSASVDSLSSMYAGVGHAGHAWRRSRSLRLQFGASSPGVASASAHETERLYALDPILR